MKKRLKKSLGQKWRYIVVMVKNAKLFEDKKAGEEMFLDILRKVPLFGKTMRKYIFDNRDEYRKQT